MAVNLTDQQRAAVYDRGGNLLVSAAAGSGKTKVLVERLLSYITDPSDPANIDDFLIITYTKAAAAELRIKIAERLNEAIAQQPESLHLQRQMQRLHMAKISTVHSFCTEVVREYAHKLDVSADFRMMDESEAPELQNRVLESVVDRAYTRISEEPAIRQLIETQGYRRNDDQLYDIILKVYLSSRCHLSPERWLDECVEATENLEVTDASQTVWGEYLIKDLHTYLDLQINALSNCARLAGEAEGMEKPAALMQDTVSQLTALRGCRTWDEIVDNKNIDYGTLRFGKNVTDMELAEQMKMVRDHCKKGLSVKVAAFSAPSVQVLEELTGASLAARGLVMLVREFTCEYDRLKRSRKIMDFSDLEHKMLDLIRGKSRTAPNAIAREIGNRFREVMVDEYQDSNEVQDAIFSALSEEKHNCFMVGDVKQSIYQFRLADPTIFIDKYDRFLPANNAVEGQDRKIVLSNNFRSSAGVIGGVNDVFSCCMSPDVGGVLYGEDEMLHEGIPHAATPDPEVALHVVDVNHDTYAEEAAYVADQIAQLLDGNHYVCNGEELRPITADDITILLRSPGSVGGEFVYALQSRGIPVCSGDAENLLSTKEISVLTSLLRVICNPLQDIPLLGVLVSNVFCYTAEELAQLRSKSHSLPVYHLLQRDDSEKTKNFLTILDALRKDAQVYSLTQLIQRILHATKLDSVFSAMPDGDQRLNHIHMFCRLAAEYEANGNTDVGRFVEHLEALAERNLLKVSAGSAGSAVHITSIHKSKGLEYPVVFLCGLSRKFNQESVTDQILCDKNLGLGLSCLDTENRVRYPTIARRAIACKMITESISEELRVLYVAMTRARDRLIMTYADSNLETTLKRLALRIPHCKRGLLTGYVNNPGAWVLLTALMRTEAGALFEIGGNPGCAQVSEIPWEIVVATAPEVNECTEQVQEESELSDCTIEQLRRSLNFCYKNLDATQIPSKQTATQLKGRAKDSEVSEHADEKRYPVYFRKPTFIEPGVTGQEYGNAYHAVMQYLRHANCVTSAGVAEELRRLVSSGLISQTQCDMVSPERISAFFTGSIGVQVIGAQNVKREFKFSILTDAPGCDEKILLQGVVDCMIIDKDGITVIDFKTDRTDTHTVHERAQLYKPQIDAYAKAVERIFQMPVKERILYFFSCSSAVSV